MRISIAATALTLALTTGCHSESSSPDVTPAHLAVAQCFGLWYDTDPAFRHLVSEMPEADAPHAYVHYYLWRSTGDWDVAHHSPQWRCEAEATLSTVKLDPNNPTN